jgi:hypothetical protein
MSAQVVETRKLSTVIRNPGGKFRLHRNRADPADGLVLGIGQAFVASVAGCPVIVASGHVQTGTAYCIVAHAGRESLIDEGVLWAQPTRLRLSVVDEIVWAFEQRGVARRHISMTMLFAVPALSFEHDPSHAIHGPKNRKLIEFADRMWPGSVIKKNGTAYLDLEQIFLAQARKQELGGRAWVGPNLNVFPSLTHTRKPGCRDARNLIAILREPVSVPIIAAA